nr:D-alanyl-D-alanine carboxypeptidase family protein [Clostridiales bacterium]
AQTLPFTDVYESDWYYGDVLYSYERGLISGTDESSFSPDKLLTYGEAAKLAACMHFSERYGGTIEVYDGGGAWYDPYVMYCAENGIIASSEGWDWTAPATRAGYMSIFAAAMPADKLPAINDIPDGAIPDIDMDSRSAQAVYVLYRAGVVQGTGDYHFCEPDSGIRRCEVAAILTRMTDASARISFTINAEPPAALTPDPVTPETPEQPQDEKGHKTEVINGVTYIDGILIVNKTYSLPSDYGPGGLTKECSDAFARLQKGAAAQGLNIYAISGYRSYDYQKGLYARYAARDGYAMADRYSARAGHSEHQTGLAIDCNSVQQSFADTAEGIWLAAHCYEYGFILRYPKGKESVTGYMYEPWHIRYLGEENAKMIADSGLTLEEYFGITSEYQD